MDISILGSCVMNTIVELRFVDQVITNKRMSSDLVAKAIVGKVRGGESKTNQRMSWISYFIFPCMVGSRES